MDILRAWVEGGTPAVVWYQKLCGVTPSGPTNWLLHPIFAVGSAMGNELFFLVFFPLLIWEFDLEVARRTMVCWSCVYYLGQVLKDLCKLPRPPVAHKVATGAELGAAWGRKAPPPQPPSSSAQAAKGVVCLESHYSAEHGMPSTHAMNSLALPWSMLAWTLACGRFQGSPLPLLAFAIFYTTACTASRPYMGVHSPADIIVGLLLGLGVLLVDLQVGEAVDLAILTHPAAPLLLLATLILLVWVYPKPKKWTSTPGDTVLVVGSTVGILISSALDGPAHLARMQPHATFHLFNQQGGGGMGAAKFFARLVVGGTVFALTRLLLKPLCFSILSAALGPAYGDAEDILAATRVGDTPMHIYNATGVPAPSPGGFPATGAVSTSAQWGGGGGGSTSLHHRKTTAPSQEHQRELQQQREGGETATSGSTGSVGGGSGEPQHPLSPSSSLSSVEATAASSSGESEGGERKGPGEGRLRIRTPVEPLSTAASGGGGGGGEGALVRLPPDQRYAIELPTKCVVYGALGVVTMSIAPRLFLFLGIDR